MVRPEDRELRELQHQFICVRLVAMNDVDVRLFEFDWDLSWMGFFVSAEGRIYSRYGGRDAKSDEGRVSVRGLKETMRRVLDLHRTQPTAWREPAVPHRPLRADQVFKIGKNACMHCHQVAEGKRATERAAGTFDPESLYVYPLPENLGLELDVDSGNKVLKVADGSAAARAGLRAGDELWRVGGVDVFAQGDVLWGLHNAPARGRLTVEVRRAGQLIPAEIELAPGWRKTDLNWRQSMAREWKYLK